MRVVAATRAPSRLSAPGPHDSTIPKVSMPGPYGRSTRTAMLTPVTRSRSLRLSGIACTRTRTSPGPGSGTSTSSMPSTSAGCPYSCMRQARMVFAVMVDAYLLGFEVEVLDVRRELAAHLVGIDAVLLGFV